MSPERIIIDSQIHFFEYKPAKKKEPIKGTPLVLNNLIVDDGCKWTTLNGENIAIHGAALEVLCLLIRAKGSPISKENLFYQVFPGKVYNPHDGQISVYIGLLRRKLGKDIIITTWGDGYKINMDYGLKIETKDLQVA